MRTIETYIDIQAPVEKIWKILLDFSSYPQWNPFITSAKGIPAKGKKLSITINLPDKGKQRFHPVCLNVTPQKELRWKGKVITKGLFDGEHIFELQVLNKKTVRLFQREYFSGLLVPLMWKKLEPATLEGFKLMNRRLKQRAENQSTK
jgi:hypothetical protein